jgi:hypothetical protein
MSKGYKEVDSFTADDGTKYVALAGSSGTRIRKIAADGTETLLASTKKDRSRSSNASTVQRQFDPFKKALETAKGGTSLSYTDDDIATNDGTAGRGIFGQKRDAASTVTLSDGTKLSAIYGKTGDEIRTVRRLADEVSNYSSSINNDDDDDDDTSGTTTLDNDTNTALTNVENISTSTFENNDDTSNYFDNTLTSAVNTAAGQDTNMASALTTSVGAAEDEAISYMKSGTGSNVVNAGGAQGLLGGDDEDDDDPFNRRKTLIGA